MNLMLDGCVSSVMMLRLGNSLIKVQEGRGVERRQEREADKAFGAKRQKAMRGSEKFF